VSYTISDAQGTKTFTGTVSGGSVSGSWEGTVLGQPESGTWRADLVTRAILDVSGSWTVFWTEQGGQSGTATVAISMAADGLITGTYDPGYEPVATASGRLYGYGLTLSVVESGRTIYFDATVEETGTTASGSWFDSDGYSGDWQATKS
jgi:hypothetical protein